jgi:hypothetical protein
MADLNHKNPIYLHILSTSVPLLLIVFLAILSFAFQPKTPTNSQVSSKPPAVTNNNAAPRVFTSPKTDTQVVTATPSTAVNPPKAVAPAKPKITVAVPKGSKVEPVVTPSPSSSVNSLTPVTPSSSSGSSSSSPTPPKTSSYTSTNWSGYLAATSSYTSVSGTWNATSVSGNGSSTSADATWIGIGGVTSGDLIQVGTQNIVSASGQVSSGAFYEMLPASSRTVPGMTVNGGDSISASVTEISSGQWTITIRDNTNSESFSINVSYSSSLSSAEWIEEDPSYVNGRLIPFDNFNSASFNGSSTTSSGNVLNLSGSDAQPITMVNSVGQPIAVPSAIAGDGASFSISP